MEASAVRFAWIEVTPNVIPSTATTSSAEARKIFAVSPSPVLVALASGIRGVVAAVLVAVRLPAVPARVQRDLDLGRGRRRRRHLFDDLGGDALVPHVQAVAARRHVVDRKTAVGAG